MQAPVVKVTQVFPEGKTVYGFTFDKSKFKWAAWGDLIDPTAIPADAEYTNIIVPTVDTVRYTFLVDQLVRSGKHCLLVGPTGTGKTAYIKKHLQGGLPDSFVPLLFNFSAQTSANMTQVWATFAWRQTSWHFLIVMCGLRCNTLVSMSSLGSANQ